ncbi:MAG: alpha/beta hydrolase [Ignavibacteria bacterium]|nr:alpha/beta hydrolase [Ignavibacteria bacterium]
MKWILGGVGMVAVVVVVFLSGPATPVPTFDVRMPDVPADLRELQQYIGSNEVLYPTKPDVAAQILWADSTPTVTDIAIVYLHGFSGTWRDGSPAIERVANDLHANVYLARLHGHGLRVAEPLLDYSPDSVYASALRALAIGKQLGKKVVVIGTSTGATLGLMLAARRPDDIAAVVNWSPNIRLEHPLSFLSNGPWGLALTRWIIGGAYREVVMKDPGRAKYWYMKYRAEAIPQLQALLEAAMTSETFSLISQPVLSMCWYQNENVHDSIVSVPAMRTMHAQLSSKRKQFIELSADAHEIGYLPDSKSLDEVVVKTVAFIEQ